MDEHKPDYPLVVLTNVACVDEISYCINCLDQLSRTRGTFAYDEGYYSMGLGHYAISPVFDSVDDFYFWGREEGFTYHKLGTLFGMSRNFE